MQLTDAVAIILVGLAAGSLILCVAFRAAVRSYYREKRAHLREILGAEDKN